MGDKSTSDPRFKHKAYYVPDSSPAESSPSLMQNWSLTQKVLFWGGVTVVLGGCAVLGFYSLLNPESSQAVHQATQQIYSTPIPSQADIGATAQALYNVAATQTQAYITQAAQIATATPTQFPTLPPVTATPEPGQILPFFQTMKEYVSPSFEFFKNPSMSSFIYSFSMTLYCLKWPIVLGTAATFGYYYVKNRHNSNQNNP